METTKEFMLVFRMVPNFSHQPTQEELSKMQGLWGEYIGNIVMQEKLVSTHRLSFDGKKVSSDLSVKNEVVMEDSYMVSGNMVVRANSIEEATDIAKGSPILGMGGTVEVRGVVPMN